MDKTICDGERNLILKVMQFFENEKRNKSVLPFDQAIKRTIAATGVSKRTLMNIKKEYRKITSSSVLSDMSEKSINSEGQVVEDCAPIARKFCQSLPRKKIEIDNSMIRAIRGIVKEMSVVKKEVPTLKKVFDIAKRDFNFPGHHETLRTIMIHKLGFKLKKFNRNKKSLVFKKKHKNIK